jgi:hypothetical protein
LGFEQATQKAFSRPLIAPTLHQDINDIAVLIDGPPQVVPFPLDGHKDFVDMPRVA